MQKSNILSLPLMEHFYTIQGEGRYTGYPSYFLRLGGCDVGCVWCDVKESWDASKHPQVNIEMMVQVVHDSTAPIAVITGGEPLMHNLDTLTSLLNEKGIRTHIETSGAHHLSGKWNWICLSPKKFKAPLAESVKAADELKVVVFNKSDFDWANSFVNDVDMDCKKYLQPEWEKSDAMTPLVIEYIKANPSWELSAQLHKYIQVP
jgi:organic radical activating enzyme